MLIPMILIPLIALLLSGCIVDYRGNSDLTPLVGKTVVVHFVDDVTPYCRGLSDLGCVHFTDEPGLDREMFVTPDRAVLNHEMGLAADGPEGYFNQLRIEGDG
jgi:hypothetical protein